MSPRPSHLLRVAGPRRILSRMNTQKAVSVNPTFGGITSLDLSALAPLLEAGWTVNQTSASSNGSILVILDAPGKSEEAQVS